MLLDGVVGDLQRLEGQCGDMYDWGTHWLDMFFFYNGEAPARWVIGQIDSRTERKVFGVPVEDQGICHVAFQNDVRGTLVTGHEASMGCANRLIGTEGVIEVGWDKTALRVRARGDADWRVVPTTEGIHDDAAHGRVAADIVRCLDTGERPLLSSYHAIQATEVIFATYESSRRRGRVDLPLQSEDSALLAMLAEGVVGPNAAR
jgi:predicted dehydrogenase